jgi:hypothetical protein
MLTIDQRLARIESLLVMLLGQTHSDDTTDELERERVKVELMKKKRRCKQ